MNTTGKTLLSREECSALRGIAILGIFMHNYLHWLAPMVKENEYLFHQKNVDGIMNVMLSPSADVWMQLFSFFGHYGVPVFLFLSGYGLVLKYESPHALPNGSPHDEGMWTFLRKHFMKLFPMMMLGLTVFAMVDWITPGHHHWRWTELLAQMTMTINLLPDPDHIIWPGPYWFFGLMMQLYLVYRVMLYRRPNNVALAAVLFCWVAQAFCFNEPEGETLNRLRYNCIGGMLPFVMGIIMARSERQITLNRLHFAVILTAAVAAVIALSLTFHAWLWAPAAVVVAHVAVAKVLPRCAIRLFAWLGTISAAIFVCHPITRKIFIPISRHGDIVDGLAIYVIATVVLAMIFQVIIRQIKKPL